MNVVFAMHFYSLEEIDPSPFEGAVVGMVGYGPQAQAQAQNLRDSGLEVLIGLRAGSPSAEKATGDGFEVLPIPELARRAEFIHLLIPDGVHGEVFERNIKPHLNDKKALVVSHGFSVHTKKLVPPEGVDVYLLAPKGVGTAVRSSFLEGRGVPVMVAVHQDASGTALDRALAHVLGAFGKPPLILRTTFEEETEADLFGEQAVLCGGLMALILSAFETLVEADVSAEAAYFECLYELQFIVNLLVDKGPKGMLESISTTAAVGAKTAYDEFDSRSKLRQVMVGLLGRIRSGEFARQLPKATRWDLGRHPLQSVHDQLKAHLR